LKEITLPTTLLTMGRNVFDQPLTIYACTYVQGNTTKPAGWAVDFNMGGGTLEWKYIELEPSEEEEEDEKESSLFGK